MSSVFGLNFIFNACSSHTGRPNNSFWGKWTLGKSVVPFFAVYGGWFPDHMPPFYSAGSHKGKFSFDTFTHSRPTMRSPSWYGQFISLDRQFNASSCSSHMARCILRIDLILSFRFPPYTVCYFFSLSRCTDTTPLIRWE
jgi:hypothetical protein